MNVGKGAQRISATDAVAMATAALSVAGAGEDTAHAQAAHLVEAELRGHPSHGLRRLPILVERMRAGLIEPNARPTFTWGADSALTVDGNHGFGPVTAEARRKATESAVSAATIRGIDLDGRDRFLDR